jgi:uncharacterized repeat protein (TIGR01451 family)
MSSGVRAHNRGARASSRCSWRLSALLSAAILGAAGLSVLSPSAQAATSYDIIDVGEAEIVSVGSDSSNTAWSSPDNLAPNVAGGNVQSHIEITGHVDDMSVLQPGDQVIIAVTRDAGSLTQTPSFQGGGGDVASGGVVQFIMSVSGNRMILTKTDAPASGEFQFDLNALINARPGYGNELVSKWIVGGNTYEFPHSPRVQQLLPTAPWIYSTSLPNGCRLSMFPRFGDQYAELLAGTLVLDGPVFQQDFVQVARVAASPNIVEVGGMQNPAIKGLYGLMDGGLGLDSAYRQDVSVFSLANAILAPDLSFAEIVSSLPAGSQAVVRNSDGSYTVAINWGRLIGNSQLTYPAGTTTAGAFGVTDLDNDALIAEAIALKLTAEGLYQAAVVTFADPTASESAQVEFETNLFPLTSSEASCSDIPQSNAAAGQTLVRVHYVDNVTGAPLVEVDASYGWPDDVDTDLGAASGDASVAPKQITGYSLVTAPAAVSVPGDVLGTGSVRTVAGTVPYPLTGLGPVDIFYAYDALPASVDVKHVLDTDDDGDGDVPVVGADGSFDVTLSGVFDGIYSSSPIGASDLAALDYELISTPANATGTYALTNPDVIYVYAPVKHAGISLLKSGVLTSSGTPQVDDLINWSFLVTNSGDFDLENVSLSDSLQGVTDTLQCQSELSTLTLAVGEQVSCSARSSLTQTDIDNALVVNTANVTAETGGGDEVSRESTAVVAVKQAPAGSLVKTVSLEDPQATVAAEGDTLTYHFALNNLGNVTLSQVNLTDPMPNLSPITWDAWPTSDGVLAPGESVSGTATYTVTAADVAAGKVSNTATAHARTPARLNAANLDGDRLPGNVVSVTDTVVMQTEPILEPPLGLPNTGGSFPSQDGALRLAVVASLAGSIAVVKLGDRVAAKH